MGNVLAELLPAYRRGKRLLLLFDYDGTLAPIAAHPSLATLDQPARCLLVRLMNRPRVSLGILSGRSLDDLKRMVRLPRVHYAGTGGLEVEVAGTRLVHPRAAEAARQIERLAESLQRELPAFPGAWLENKVLGLTVHYRAAAEEQVLPLKARVEAILRSAADPVRIVEGPKAIEITPDLGWNKGTAVRTILQCLGAEDAAILYAGDGANDADAFQAAAALGGVALGVGPHAPPAAQHVLPDHPSLLRFLAILNSSLDEAEPGASNRPTSALALHGSWKPLLPTNPT